jgi:hypothetical protein
MDDVNYFLPLAMDNNYTRIGKRHQSVFLSNLANSRRESVMHEITG